jgi:fatty-acyl-CoA synthase
MDGIEVNNESDIAAFERSHPHFMQLPSSTYAVLQQAASRLPDGKAIKYFIHGDSYDAGKIPFKRHCQYHLSRLFLGIPSLKPYEEVTYRELFERVTQTCNLLNDLGVKKTDSVSLLLPNFPETVYSLFAAETVGVANPVNPLLEPDLIVGILNEVKCKVLITMGPVPGTDIWKKVLAIKDRIPSLEHIIVIKGRKARCENIHNYEQTISRYSGTKLDNPQTRKLSDVACYYHTGGTTGMPKIVKSTFQNKLFSSKLLLALANVKPVDTGLLVLPLFHVNATINCLAAVMGGLTTVMPGPMGFRTPMVKDNFFKIAKHHRITYFSSVPTIFSALLANKDIGTDHDIRFVVSGAAPLPEALQTAFEEVTNIPIIEGYGQTEATVGSTLNPIFGKRKRGSVGLRFPFTQIKVVTLDDNKEFSRDCGVNEIGHIVVRGPHVCSGYLQVET